MLPLLKRWVKRVRLGAVPIAILGIGIGLTTAMGGLLDALLIRPPLHLTRPDRLIRLTFSSRDAAGRERIGDRAELGIIDRLAEANIFDGIAVYRLTSVAIGRGSDAGEVTALEVNRAFFRVLRVRV